MSRWLILRTSGGQTLPLAASLDEAGIAAWTPARTLRRYMPARTPSGKRLVETDVAILPTFVFVHAPGDERQREAQIQQLSLLSAQTQSPHPAFSVFRYVDRLGQRLVPFVADHEIAGLRQEETEQAATIAAMRAAESHAEAERIRLAAIRSASARRRAEQALKREQRATLRAQGCAIAAGADVQVSGVPAFVGVTGVMERVDGHYAHVRFGNSSWKIEGWQVMPADDTAPQSLAA